MLEIDSRDYLDDPDEKRFFNVELFAEVAPKYDFVTRALSFGRDQAWKRKLLATFPTDLENPICVDLACGTGDLCKGLARRYPHGRVIGIDLSAEMLQIARQRWAEHSDEVSGSIEFRRADMGQIALPDASVDLVSGSYALRNAAELDPALSEISRILKPGGTAAFLDFSKSPRKTLAKLSHGLLKFWGGFWGLALHRKAAVYGYIADSLARFPDRGELAERCAKNGLRVERSKFFFGGMLQLLVLHREDDAARPPRV